MKQPGTFLKTCSKSSTKVRTRKVEISHLGVGVPPDSQDWGIIVMMKARVLVAEDEPKQAELLRRYLEAEGYAVVITSNGRQAVDEARRLMPDLVIADIMMPLMDGLDVCRVLRYETDIPIIFVSARSTEEDMLLGLDLGADDYITKPYSPRILMAKVRTVLRRNGGGDPASDQLFHFGDVTVDTRKHEITKAGRPVDATPKEFAILATLCSDRGRAFTRRQLLEAAFGFNYDGLERTVDVHVVSLRKKIELDPSEPAHIQTVYGVGYRLADPEQLDDPEQPTERD